MLRFHDCVFVFGCYPTSPDVHSHITEVVVARLIRGTDSEAIVDFGALLEVPAHIFEFIDHFGDICFARVLPLIWTKYSVDDFVSSVALVYSVNAHNEEVIFGWIAAGIWYESGANRIDAWIIGGGWFLIKNDKS